jgi:hypothetical protein
MLRRFLRRMGTGNCSGKMLIRDLQVMFVGYGSGVAHPLAHHMGWKSVCQFCLAGRATILPWLGPAFYACPRDNTSQLSSQVLVAVAIPSNDVLIAWFRLFPGFL